MKKLAIVGTHPDTRENAPFEDAEFDVWVFNEAAQAEWCRRWTACFQMHKEAVYTSEKNMVRADHWVWLQRRHGSGEHGERVIWMQERDERVPNSARFPLEEIRATVPAAALDGVFTSTLAMSMALALYLGYEHVEIYGVDLGSNTEYAYQQMAYLYWVGAAKSALGEHLALKSGLRHFAARVYGYEGEVQIERGYFTERAAIMGTEKRARETVMRRLYDRLSNAVLENQYGRFAELIVEAQNQAQELGEAAGALQEAQQYAGRDDPISRQQFERRSAQAQEDGDRQRSLMDKESGKLEYVWNVWQMTGGQEARNQVRQFYGKLLEYALSVGGNLGVWRENAMYMVEYDRRFTAAGGERTVRALTTD